MKKKLGFFLCSLHCCVGGENSLANTSMNPSLITTEVPFTADDMWLLYVLTTGFSVFVLFGSLACVLCSGYGCRGSGQAANQVNLLAAVPQAISPSKHQDIMHG